jgi:hypothetical protein
MKAWLWRRACPGLNNTDGNGRIDVFEAVSEMIGERVDIQWLVAGPLHGEVAPGESITTTVRFDAGALMPGINNAGNAILSNDPA